MYASTVAFLVCSFLGFALTSIAVVPQFHGKLLLMVVAVCGADQASAERIGIFMHVLWVGGGCLLSFLNGIIWRNDALNRAPIFCDISEYEHSASINSYFNAQLLISTLGCMGVPSQPHYALCVGSTFCCICRRERLLPKRSVAAGCRKQYLMESS